MVTLEAADRNARPPLSADERRGYHLAFFALSAAVNDAGFHVLAPGAGRLEVHPPDGMAREVSAPIADALEAHKADIIDLLRGWAASPRGSCGNARAGASAMRGRPRDLATIADRLKAVVQVHLKENETGRVSPPRSASAACDQTGGAQ